MKISNGTLVSQVIQSQYNDRSAKMKRNARLRKANGPAAEFNNDVDFIYEEE